MDRLMLIDDQLNMVVWGKYMISFLLFTGFWLMLRTRFFPPTHVRLILHKTLDSLGKDDKEGRATPFRAIATVLVGTLRVGNAADITMVLATGGSGTLLWMRVNAILNMMTKYAEVVFTVHYHMKERDGTFIGGPMTTLESGCHMGFPGTLSAVLCIFASFGVRDVTPANMITYTITSHISILSWSVDLIIAFFITWITFGKGNLITWFNRITIPVTSVFCIAMYLYLTVSYADMSPQALRLVRYDAMRPMTGVDGTGSFAISRVMHFGISRGVFSSEAGMGSLPISHACASHANTTEQGFWGIFEMFFDTTAVCTITGLTISTSGLLGNGMEGVALAIAYSTSDFGYLGGITFPFSTVVFAIPSVLDWYYYAQECLRYLLRGKLMLYIHQGVFPVLLAFGAQLQLTFVWDVTDTLNGLIAISNLISLVVLYRAVIKLTKEYLEEHGSDQMKVVIACDSHEDCMTSREVAERIELGIRQADNVVITTPHVIDDDGEGTVEAFHETYHGGKQPVGTTDAYGKKIIDEYTIIGDGETAMIEVASTMGLNMHERDKWAPFFGSSYGVGTVMLDAAAQSCRKIIIDLSGSAINDDGVGLLQALGCRSYDSPHKYLSPQAMNLDRARYVGFNRLNKSEDTELIVACNVKNHLLGENGATYVFGKRKGFPPNRIRRTDLGMESLRNQVRRYLYADVDSFDGRGVTGGIGTVLIGILHANMVSGIGLSLSFSDTEGQVKDCDLVIIGGGRSDRQAMLGKVPVGILKIANCHHRPRIYISDALGAGYQELYGLGFIGMYSIADRTMTFRQTLDNVPDKLTATTYGVMRTVMYYMNRISGNRG